MKRLLLLNFIIGSLLAKDFSEFTVNDINSIAIKGDIKRALRILEKRVKSSPDNKELHLLNAKLLYWNKEINRAKKEIEPYKTLDKELYKRIYLAWSYEHIKRVKNPYKRVIFFNNLKSFAKSAYDIYWLYIDALIEKKELKKALRESEKFKKLYPKSQEANERVAKLLFWNGEYKKSLKLYKSLSKKYHKNYAKEITQLKNILYPKKSTTIKIEIDKKIVKSSQNRPKHMIGFGFQNRKFSDNRYKDVSYILEGTLPIRGWTIYFNAQKTKRYNKIDSKVYAEIYPKLPKPHWGYISLTYSFESNYFAKYSIGWHHFYDYKKWEIGAGFEISRYDKFILLLSGGYSYTLSDSMIWIQTLYYAPKSKSYALVNRLKYSMKRDTNFYLQYTISNSKEELKESSKILKTNKRSLTIGGEVPLSNQYRISFEATKDWFRDGRARYSRSSINLGLRYYW